MTGNSPSEKDSGDFIEDHGIMIVFENDIKRTVSIGDAVLHLGDCLSVLQQIGPVNAVITDPPYGTGWIVGGSAQGKFNASAKRAEWDNFGTEWINLCVAEVFACFCPDGRVGDLMQAGGKRMRYYVKSNPRPPLAGNDAPSVEPIVIWPRVKFSRGPAHMTAYNGDAEHPCQKPLSVMEWLINDLTAPGDLVLDPFMGSGTTGVACANLQRRFIGIEINENYFQIACHRIRAAHSQKRLFA